MKIYFNYKFYYIYFIIKLINKMIIDNSTLNSSVMIGGGNGNSFINGIGFASTGAFCEKNDEIQNNYGEINLIPNQTNFGMVSGSGMYNDINKGIEKNINLLIKYNN